MKQVRTNMTAPHVKYLNVLHHNRTQKQLGCVFLNILHKYYQLPILVNLYDNLHQKR